MSENAIVVQTSSAYLAPVADVMTARMRYQGMKDFVSSIMVQGVDFGAVPGTDKPTLLKPGAEKLSSFFGLSPMFTVTEKITDWTGAEHNNEPLFYYSYRCDLMKNGVVVGQGEGSANTWEKKYRWRNSDLLCPECGKDAIKRSKYPPRNNPKAQPGWYCYSKAGGCGAEFSADDKRITEQPRGKIANPDIFDVVNTVQKMAQKRALVAAVLIAVNASEYFTQDVEDFIDASWEPTPPPPAHQTTDREPTPVAVQAAAELGATVKDVTTPATPQQPPLRYQPVELRIRLAQIAQANDVPTGAPPLLDDKHRATKRGVIISALESVLSARPDPRAARYQLTKFLINCASLSEASDGELVALEKWLNISKDSGGVWLPEAMATREALAAYNHSQPQQDKMI